jgi:S-formylglutathione hydrolase FrmB
MALIRLDHTPETVNLNLPLYIILPDPAGLLGEPLQNRKVLYLLHGLSEDGSSWQRYSSIETVAAAYGLVVVMPSVGRSFYTDLPNGQRYFSYLTEELPQYLAGVFTMVPSRENTLIAGVSMGGYGAFKAAFTYPERFAAAASFSGFLSLEFLRLYPNDPRREEFSHLFGDLEKLPGSLHDPAGWFEQAAADPSRLPRLFMACGSQDDLYPINRSAYNALQDLGIPVDYHEEDARHDWFFWDAQIRRFLASVLGPVPTL